ncbi:MAG: hypothetical protein Kow001_04190 [Acidobacteriota bacterium]
MSPSRDLRLILLAGTMTALAVAVAGGVNLFYPQFASGLLDALSTLIPGFERTSTPQKVLKLALVTGTYAGVLVLVVRLLVRRIRQQEDERRR